MMENEAAWKVNGYVPDSDGEEEEEWESQEVEVVVPGKGDELVGEGNGVLEGVPVGGDGPIGDVGTETAATTTTTTIVIEEEGEGGGGELHSPVVEAMAETEIEGLIVRQGQEGQCGDGEGIGEVGGIGGIGEIGEVEVLDLTEVVEEDEDGEDGGLGGGGDDNDEVPVLGIMGDTGAVIIRSPTPPPPPSPPPRELSITPRAKQSQSATQLTSSPLSEAPSNICTPTPSPAPQPQPTRPPPLAPFSIILPQPSFPSEDWSPTEISPNYESHDDFTSGPLRNLRQRKPIQLNPYQIEQARYRQTLKSRGVRPIIIQNEESQVNAPVEEAEEEYEASADEDESQPRRTKAHKHHHQDELAQPQPQIRADSFIAYSTETSSSMAGVEMDDYELPDVHTLLWESGRRGAEVLQSEAVKRRKITHTYSNKVGRAPGTGWVKSVAGQSSEMAKGRQVEESREGERGDTSIDPADGSSPVRPSQRRPLAQRSLNTLSPRKTIQLISSEDDDTPPQSSIRRGFRQLTPSPPASNHSESDVEVDADIRRLQKKTNGVLPASWWKLDQKRQTAKEAAISRQQQRLGTRSPPGGTPKPGVARAKISKNRPERRDTPGDLFLNGDSSDSDDGSDGLPTILPHSSAARPRSSGTGAGSSERSTPGLKGWIAFDDDVMMEDDRIDPMLQKSYSRKKQSTLKVSRTKKTKQSDGTNPKPTSSASKPSSARARDPWKTQSTSSRRPRGSGGPSSSSSKRQKRAAPRLSVLDAYEYHQETFQASPPRFLKVARRTARKKRDGAVAGPEGKMFVLDTEADTREVQGVLREWREGTLDVVAYARKKYPDREARERRIGELGRAERGDGGVRSSHLEPPPNIPAHPIFRPSGSQTQKPTRKKQTTLMGIVDRQPKYTTSSRFSKNSSSSKARPIMRNHQTILRPDITTAGQIESLSGEFYTRPPVIRAPVPLIDILRQKKPMRPTAFHHPSLGKFLDDDDLVVNPLLALKKLSVQRYQNASPLTNTTTNNNNNSTFLTAAIPPIPRPSQGGRRKRPPRRIDADTRERRQPPPEHVPTDFDETEVARPIAIDLSLQLTGLAPYGTKYSLNFDTHPLKPGTIFNSETFIGSGEFARAFSTPAGGGRVNSTLSVSYTYAREHLQWGVYCDRVSTDFEIVMESLMDRMEKAFEQQSQDDVDLHLLATQAYSFYRFTCDYVARILHFSDSIDVVSFSQRFLKVLESCLQRVSTAFSGVTARPDLALPSTRMGIQTLVFVLVLSWQMFCICGRMEGAQRNSQLETAIKVSTKTLISKIFRCGSGPVRQCYEDQMARSHFERGIGSDAYVVEAWVVAIHVLDGLNSPVTTFWKFFNSELHMEDLGKVADATIYEQCWKAVFSVLPLFQFDVDGVVGHGQSAAIHHSSMANWDLLKKLATVLFKHYQDNTDQPKINDYIRIIYTRTQHLMSKWHWPNSEAMIATLFGFFAGNGFSNLRNEFDHGSPLFLQKLESSPSLLVEDTDRCFHILLKLIASRIISMREATDTPSATRKIQSFVFRLMPNHRRHYPKEDELRLEHLTALRNHHDLLCTLYWASPRNCRPPLTVIRDLVDPATSHTQACTVSIRAWAYITRFQAHADEDLSAISPLMEWYEDLITQTLTQHNSCRAEARKQFTAERGRGNVEISEEDLEDTIRRNQRQLEVLLLEGSRLLGTVMKSVDTKLPSAMKLFTPAATGTIFSAFNKVSPKLVNEALNVLSAYLDACQYTPPSTADISQVVSVNEESQDYGDFEGMEDLVIEGEKKAAGELLISVAYEPLLRMVLSAFGAEQQPADTLLVHILDTWVRVIGFLVQQGLKTWDTFLGGYSHESWLSFPETEQKNKFTAYYMASLINKYKECYDANKSTFMSLWLRTLVERKSMLKYQNDYTNALLNVDSENPILYNLPFTRRENGLYGISLTEFESRRISIISTVLSNMRISYDTASPYSAPALRKEYSNMLQLLMTSMRDNYLTLRDPQETARVNVYVSFVQKVIELLQQHAIDIVPIDKFFTDSSAFPLPATDPTYVIGKLRNYGLKLGSLRTHKQLMAFFQTVSERAAVDGQQEYLVDQITRALTGGGEHSSSGAGGGRVGGLAGDVDTPTTASTATTTTTTTTTTTLRGFFLQVVFPVYLENAFLRGPTHQIQQPRWILASPVALAAKRILERIREDFDSCDFCAVGDVLAGLGAWVEAVRRAVSRGVRDHGVLGLLAVPEWLATLTTVVESVTPCLAVVDWLGEAVRRGRRRGGRKRAGGARGFGGVAGLEQDEEEEEEEEDQDGIFSQRRREYESIQESVVSVIHLLGWILRKIRVLKSTSSSATLTTTSTSLNPGNLDIDLDLDLELDISIHTHTTFTKPPPPDHHNNSDDPFHAVKEEQLANLLAQEWIPDFHNHNNNNNNHTHTQTQWICARRPVSQVTINSWKTVLGIQNRGGDVDAVEIGRTALMYAIMTFLGAAARTEMGWSVVREVDAETWERERNWEA
ncbi:Mus7/MMS22 family-domain-containing protein [Peziza echinospora]|nr:Mus7/MMS22 family-domain-containing protein [Peziza echinospora]